MSIEEILKWLLGILGALVVGWLTMISWIGKRLIQSVDEKSDGKATESRFEQLLRSIDSHQSDDRDIHREVVGKLDSLTREIAHKLDIVNAQIGTTNAQLSGVIGGLKAKGIIT